MRKLAIVAALASTIGAVPALARDYSPYVGIEGGFLRAEDTGIDYRDIDDDIPDALIIDHKMGIDADLIAGYDFGAFRVEGELGYKRARTDDVRADSSLFASPADADFGGSTRVLSGMVNALLDFGGNDSLGGYVGGGVGLARVKMRADLDPVAGGFSGKDRGFAWQVLAGVRAPITDKIDLGLKYRFFNTKFDFGDSSGGGRELDGKFRSHSLLASLIFNFGAPVAPPPPPPPPPPPLLPATQTCPDGSVILATDSCPLPPPPPPPPPPAPERG